MNERALRDRQIHGDGVDQQIIGRRIQPLDGAAHSQARGLIDVDAIDFESVARRPRPRRRRARESAWRAPRGVLAISCLLSFRPRMGRSGERITAAAKTGPNKAPRPTSSTPAIRWKPCARASRSNLAWHLIIRRSHQDKSCAALLAFAETGGLALQLHADSTAWRGERGRCEPRRCDPPRARAAGKYVPRPGRS